MFMFCCNGHSLRVVRVGFPTLSEELTVTPLGSLCEMTSQRDWKLSGSKGDVCEWPLWPVQQALSGDSGGSAPGRSASVWAAALPHGARHFGHPYMSCKPPDVPRWGNLGNELLCIVAPHCKMGIVILACPPPQEFCKE